MPELELPPEGAYTDIEQDIIDNEPPGLLPGDQNSYWGQARAIFAANLQTLADMFAQWYLNLDPNTVNSDDMDEWEREYGIPVRPANRTTEQRRAFLLSRFQRGPFTRTRRRQLVEAFIIATFGPAIQFTPDGIPFTADGIPFYSDSVDLAGTYNIVEDIPNFSYDVRILDTVVVDQEGLERELMRITPAGITFTITLTSTP